MENGRVGLSSSQVNRVVGKKWVILSRLKTGSSQSGCESGRLTCIFHMNFFIFIIFILYIYIYIYIKKTSCIYHLESHATNHLM